MRIHVWRQCNRRIYINTLLLLISLLRDNYMYTLSRSDYLLLSIASTHMTSAKIHNRLLSFFFYMRSFPDRQLNQSPVSTRVMVFLRWNDSSIVKPFLFCLDSTSTLKRRITWFLWFKFRSLGIRLTITCHSLSRYTCANARPQLWLLPAPREWNQNAHMPSCSSFWFLTRGLSDVMRLDDATTKTRRYQTSIVIERAKYDPVPWSSVHPSSHIRRQHALFYERVPKYSVALRN